MQESRSPPSGKFGAGRDGRMLEKSARAFQEVLHRVLDAAAFPSEPNGRVRRYITFHGLGATQLS